MLTTRLPRPVLASLTLAFSSTFLLAGYECVRSASNTLFKRSYGVANYPLIVTLVPFGIIALLWIYSRVLTASGPRRTLSLSILGSGLALAGCYYLSIRGIHLANAVLLVLREAYVILVIEQFWSFINSVLSTQEARRYNGIIMAISGVGGVTGGFLVHRLAAIWGTEQMVLFGAILCLPCWFFSYIAYSISDYEHSDEVQTLKATHRVKADTMGLSLFKEHRILLSIFGMVLFSQFLSFFASYHFQEALDLHLPDADLQTSYSGLFFASVNFSSVVLQLGVLPIVLPNFKLQNVHLFLPLVNIAAVSIALLYPSLWTASAVLFVFKAFDYSVFRAAKEILYIPLPFEARFRTKEIIDVFGYRFSKSVVSGATILLKKCLPGILLNHLGLCLLWAIAWLFAALTLRQEKNSTTKKKPGI